MTAGADVTQVKAAPAVRQAARIDRVLEWLGERLNPILVKEARQALKSRQFLLAFGLLLIAAWGWSLIGLVVMEVGDGYGQAGPGMFVGYYCILAAAIGVFVPFAAFRSLAGEQEDRTYELLAITNLTPRQIVSGKLGSAVVQLLIYLSAIAPCLAFTYLLRGISMPMIAFILIYSVLGSIGLSAIGLLAGTLTSAKHWQVLLSVALIVALLLVTYSAIWISAELVDEGDTIFRLSDFWPVMAIFLTIYVAYFALVFYAAVAQITFVSDNRATRLRVIMLIQHACLVAWCGWGFLTQDDEVILALVGIGAFHWAVMGALMTGEWPELSLRVRRSLPQTFLGRTFYTWFNPGPGTGYVFASSGMIALTLTTWLLLVVGISGGAAHNISDRVITAVMIFSTLAASYVIAYLGMGLLLIRFVRRFTRPTLFSALLFQIMLVTVGTAGPFVVASVVDLRMIDDYSLLQITNPFWSCVEMFDRRNLPQEAPILLVAVPLAALVVFLLNLPATLKEIRHVRIEKPARVAEEDEQIEAALHPSQGPVPISPWDVE